ncbi:MAG: O-antigen ligase family protein [Phycisphaerales bacterium]|jgi:hypothetical protein|nr:O-antigen ligase family protein [Phycisphaerales bacterium]
MDKLDLYLEIVPLPVLALVAVIACIVFAMMPANHRPFILIWFLPSWLFLSKCLDLGVVQAATKLSSGLLLLMIAVAGFLRPGERRHMPGVVWLYVIAGVWMMACVMGTSNQMDMLLLRGQGIMMALAAISIVACLRDLEDLARFMRAMAVGTTVALIIPASSIVFQGSGAFLAGMHRLEPWGAASNLIGITFAISGAMLLYLTLTSKSSFWRAFCMAGFAASIGFAYLTGSRMSFMSLGVISLLMLIPMVKRPGMLLGGALIAAILVPIITGVEEGAGGRLTELHTSGRFGIWADYLRLFIQRPLGLFGTSGNNGLMDNIIGNHAHNAWVDMLFVGGFPLFLMLAIPAYMAGKTIWRTWRLRKLWQRPEDQMTIHTSASIMAAMFLQSMTNQALYYPTFTWAFLGMVFFMFFISFREDVDYMEADAWAQAEAWDAYEEAVAAENWEPEKS